METINIKWKEYIQVNERIKEFRTNEKYEGYTLTSEIVSLQDWVIIIKATIKNKEWIEVANWLAYEKENSTFINKTSYIENCETSAWGRALWNLWIWIDTSIASAEEVWNAIIQQKEKPLFTPTIFTKFKETENYKDYIEAKDNIEKKYRLDLKMAKEVKEYYETKDNWVDIEQAKDF